MNPALIGKLAGVKMYVYATLIVLIIVVAIYWFAFKSGKDKGSTTIEQVPLPTDTVSETDEGLSISEATQVRTIAQELHEDMDGWNVFSHKLDPYRDWNNLSDTLFVAVYNDFNTLFADSGETLRQWIEGEKWYTFGMTSIFTELKTNLISRMNRLNLQ